MAGAPEFQLPAQVPCKDKVQIQMRAGELMNEEASKGIGGQGDLPDNGRRPRPLSPRRGLVGIQVHRDRNVILRAIRLQLRHEQAQI